MVHNPCIIMTCQHMCKHILMLLWLCCLMFLPCHWLLQVCRRVTGATVKCALGHCTNHFHPLCGRARGFYLAVRPGSKAGSLSYKAFCGAHSDRERAKDREAPERTALPAAAGVSGVGSLVGLAVHVA